MPLRHSIFAALTLLPVSGGMLRAQEVFAAPRRTVREILALPVGAERSTLSGTVIQAHSVFFVIQDASGSAFINPPPANSLVGKFIRPPMPQPGDVVNVEGVRGTTREVSPEIYDAKWRVTGHRGLPEAPLLSMSDALSLACDGQRVRVRGYVVDYEHLDTAPGKVSRIWLRSGETVTYGNVIAPDFLPQPVEKGLLVEMEGVCAVTRVAPNVVRSFAMHLNSMRDVRAVPEPFSWEKSGGLRVALIAGGVLMLAAAWIFLLRRQVRLRTATIAAREAELRTALEREKELGALKTSFVSLVSHEFRTPLNVIVTSSDILSRYLERLPEEERAEHLASIQGSVKRMSGMMEDVLLLGKFESGMQKFQPEELHLAAWCRRFVDEMQSATSARCAIDLTLGNFPAVVRADESLLRHILANLVSNAAKYSPEGAVVKLIVTQEGRDAVFRVEDKGIGIPEADRPRLFEAFQRGSNVGNIAGTGLGLVVVKRGVDMHGGSLEFTSNEGCGTTFTVRLPLFSDIS